MVSSLPPTPTRRFARIISAGAATCVECATRIFPYPPDLSLSLGVIPVNYFAPGPWFSTQKTTNFTAMHTRNISESETVGSLYLGQLAGLEQREIRYAMTLKDGQRPSSFGPVVYWPACMCLAVCVCLQSNKNTECGFFYHYSRI